MALRLPSTQVALVAGRSGLHLATTCVSVTGSCGLAADSFGGRSYLKGAAVCQHRQVLKSRVSNEQQQESLSSSWTSRLKAAQPVNQLQGSYTGVPGNEAHPNPSVNLSALIDIEDSGNGSVTFKYGAVEDLWDLDKLLEFVSSGAFSSHTAESFVRIFVELFRVPVSYTGQRKMVELLSSQIRLNSDVSPEKMEETVSQVLAEAATRFLPPSSVGSYSKGSARPLQRFSSRVDKWWKKLDDYLGFGEGSVDFLSERPSFEGVGGHLMQQSGNSEKLIQRSYYGTPFQLKYTEAVSANTTTGFTWNDPPSQMPWLARPSDRLYLELPKTMDFTGENHSSPRQVEGEYIAGLDFVMFQSQVDSLEDVLRKTEVEEEAPRIDLRYAPLSNNVETIPAASIQAMVDWEREELFVTSAISLPSKHGAGLKAKSLTRQTKKKRNPRVRGSTTSTKSSATFRKKSTTGRNEPKLCDMFFGLPISHKCSGVSSFLVMRKNFGGEMLVVMNQVAVAFAGAGLAVTLHVVARMLSVNSTFDSWKLFGLIRGTALMVLSAAMQSVRKVMLRLPAGCTVSDFKDKAELLCLQERLRRLSFTAMTVMVLTVVGHGM